MSSEPATAAGETRAPGHRALVIGIGHAGAEICSRIIKYSAQRHGGQPIPGLECISIGFPADRPDAACSFIELEVPGLFSPEDYSALKAQEAWSWLPEPGSPGMPGQVQNARFYPRMALFKSISSFRSRLTGYREAAGVQAGQQVPVFLAADAGEPAGSAIFLDVAAVAYDVFGVTAGRGFCGILLMPGSGSRPGECAGAYAMLKETDFFMHGGRMRFAYPDGSDAVMSGKVFGSGNLFILDPRQFGAICVEEGSTCIDKAARFIELMTLPAANSLTHSLRLADRFDKDGSGAQLGSPRSWSSFGLCSGLNPYAAPGEAAAAHAAAAILDEFFKPVDPARLLHELERIRNMPGAPCGAACVDIMHRINPASAKMSDAVTAEIRDTIERASPDSNDEKIKEACLRVADAYSSHGVGRFRYGLVSAMEIRAFIELEKTMILLLPEIYAMLNDPGMGFYFAVAAIDSMAARLKSFREVFKSSAGRISLYTAGEMLSGIEDNPAGTAEQVAEMASFNYRQFLYICMIEASTLFIEKMIFLLDEVRLSVSEKIIVPAARLQAESRSMPRDAGFGTARDTDSSVCAAILAPADILTALPGEGMPVPSPYAWLRERLYSVLNGRIPDGPAIEGAVNVQDHLGRMLACAAPLISLLGPPGVINRESSLLFTCDPFPGDFTCGIENTGFSIISDPGFKLKHEAVMVSLVNGFSLRDISRMEDFSRCYHELTASKEQLHLYNSTVSNALYFPDPLGNDFMEPSMLWSALILLRLVREENGRYVLDDPVSPVFRETSARMKYKKAVTDTGRRLTGAGAEGQPGFELVADAVNMLGMLAKGSGGGIVFRREYASAIRDILDAHDSARAVTGREGVQQEVFSSTADIASFLESHPAVADFILGTIKSIIAATGRGNAYGSFVMLPASRIAQTPLPSFDGARSFADYCLENGSPGFFTAIKKILIVKLDEYISSKFTGESGNAGPSAAGITEFLRAVEARVPLCVISSMKEMYGISSD